MRSHDHGRHGNPEDLAAYVARMEDPGRDRWQRPARVLRALHLGRARRVCDIGAGPGYFTLRIARSLGRRGRVVAVEVEPAILGVLRDRIARARVHNVTPVLGLPHDPLLPGMAFDLILIVDTYHHLPAPVAYLKMLRRSLAPGGRIVNIDFFKRELPVGPPFDHKVSREEFLCDARQAGLRMVEEPTFLPYQYFLILEAARR